MKRLRRYLRKLTNDEDQEFTQEAVEPQPLGEAHPLIHSSLGQEEVPIPAVSNPNVPFLQKVKQRFPYYIPIFSWIPKYDVKANLPGDVVAGLGVAAMLVPQSLAYASLAGLPPAFGLYTSWIPVMMYFLFGTSKQLSIGPDALSSLLVGISVLGHEGHDLSREQIACIITFLVGVLLLLLGLLRVGFLDNVLSRPLLCGFINAVALTIVIEQLDPLFGLKGDVNKHGWDRLLEWFKHVSGIHWATFGIGFVTVYLIVLIKFLKYKFPRFLKIVPETLIAVVLGTGACAIFKFNNMGVTILGDIPQGIPLPVVPRLDHIDTVAGLIPDAALIAIIGFIEHIVAAKIYAQKNKYTISANRELVALGVGNLGGTFFNAYPTVASLTRSAIADALGAKTQIFGLIASLVVLLTILFLGPLFYYLPKVVMAGIIIVAAVGLFEVHEIIFLVKIRAWGDLVLAAITFLATIFFGIEIGVGISLALSVFLVIKHTTLPHFTILGRLIGTNKYRDVSQFATESFPGILIIRPEETLYFANIQGIKSILNRIEYLGAPHAHPSEDGHGVAELKAIILHCGNIPTIDASAIETLKHMTEDYTTRKIFVGIVKLRDELKLPFVRADIIKTGVHIFDSVQQAVEVAQTFVNTTGKESEGSVELSATLNTSDSNLPQKKPQSLEEEEEEDETLATKAE